MKTRTRTAAIAATAAALLALSACSSDSGNEDKPADAGNGSDSQPDVDQADDDADEADEADEDTDGDDSGNSLEGDLAVGDTYTWDDTGVSVTVDEVTERTEFGEYDFFTEGATAFSVGLTIANDGDGPIDLMDIAVIVRGATSGGDVNFDGASDDLELSGRLAAGESVSGTWSDSINEEYGRDLLITIGYWHDGESMMAEDPKWLASID